MHDERVLRAVGDAFTEYSVNDVFLACASCIDESKRLDKGGNAENAGLDRQFEQSLGDERVLRRETNKAAMPDMPDVQAVLGPTDAGRGRWA